MQAGGSCRKKDLWLAATHLERGFADTPAPPEMAAAHLNLDESALKRIPTEKQARWLIFFSMVAECR